MPSPFFSVIVPTLNSGPKLEATLRSLLEQPDADGEVIVMDGGSTDGTLEILQRWQGDHPRLAWRSGPDNGIYEAMNQGIALASGAYLYFIGAGDRLRPDAFQKVRQAAPEQDLALVYGDVQIVSSARLHGGGGPYTVARLVYDAPCHQAIFYARGLFDSLGLYEPQYRVSADWAFNMKCFGNADVQKIYLDTVIADFEGGGVSAHGPDALFLRDRARLVRDRLGLNLGGSRVFAMDQFLALRIAAARSRMTRKFWRAPRVVLHHLTKTASLPRTRAARH